MERVVINISIILTLCTCVDILSNAKKKITKYWFDLFTFVSYPPMFTDTSHQVFTTVSVVRNSHLQDLYIVAVLLDCDGKDRNSSLNGL